MIDILKGAGIFVYPLMVCSIVGCFIIFERMFALRRAAIIPNHIVEGIVEGSPSSWLFASTKGTYAKSIERVRMRDLFFIDCYTTRFRETTPDMKFKLPPFVNEVCPRWPMDQLLMTHYFEELFNFRQIWTYKTLVPLFLPSLAWKYPVHSKKRWSGLQA